MLDRDLIGWTIDRQDGVISLDYTQNRHTRIRDTRSEIHVITAAELEADALANNCYADLEDTREPQWDMMATDAGYALVQERFAVQ